MPAQQTAANIDAVLIDHVEKKVVAQLPQRFLFYQLVEKSVAKTSGRGRSYQIVIKTQYGESYRAMRAPEPLPDPSVGKHERVSVPTKIIAATFDIDALSEAVSEGEENSVVDVLKDGTDDLDLSLKRNWSRQLYMMHDGALAKVQSIDTVAKTITLEPASLANRWGAQFFRPGMRISASANVTAANYIAEKPLDCEIVDVDYANDILTVDTLPAGACAAGDFLFMGGPRFTSKNREFMGMLEGIDDGGIAGSFLGKSRSGIGGSLWQSHVLTAGSSNLETMLIKSVTTIRKRSGAEDVFDMLVSNEGVFNAYAAPFLAGRTWAQAGGSPMQVTGGFTNMKINLGGKMVHWWVDPDMLPGTLFGWNKKFAKRMVVKEPGWWIGKDGKPVRSSTSLVSRYVFWAAGDFVPSTRPNTGLRYDEVTELAA